VVHDDALGFPAPLKSHKREIAPTAFASLVSLGVVSRIGLADPDAAPRGAAFDYCCASIGRDGSVSGAGDWQFRQSDTKDLES